MYKTGKFKTEEMKNYKKIQFSSTYSISNRNKKTMNFNTILQHNHFKTFVFCDEIFSLSSPFHVFQYVLSNFTTFKKSMTFSHGNRNLLQKHSRPVKLKCHILI